MNKRYGKITRGIMGGPAVNGKKFFFVLQSQQDPTPPEPPEPEPPTPDPPGPSGEYHPWLSNPGNNILSGPWFINVDYGGLNECVARSSGPVRGSVLPNCTGYAWGRVCYLMGGANPHLSNNGASRWYNIDVGGIYNTWPRSQTPTLGAVACWYQTESDGSRGWGHVAVVEQINYDSGGNWTSFVVSESGASGGWSGWGYGGCQNATVYRSNLNRFSGNYTFQGFINTPSELIVQ